MNAPQIAPENLVTEPLGEYRNVSIGDLKKLKPDELMRIFRRLPSPTLPEMQGEFNGYYLGCSSRIDDCTWRFIANSYLMGGRWKGKSFTQLTESIGRGFNHLDCFGMRVAKYPMRTSIEASRYDGKPMFQLRYAHYFSACGLIGVVDEFRKLSDTLYLCVAHSRFWKPMWFVLKGPIGPFDDAGV